MPFNDGHRKIVGIHIVIYVMLHNFAFVKRVEHFFFHHTLAHGRHLRTMVGVDDPCHDVASESGADLIKQILIGLSRLSIFMIAYLQRSTVGGEAATQRGGYSGPEVASDDRRAHQAYLRLDLLKEINQYGRVRQGGVGRQARIVENMQHVDAVRENLFAYFAQMVSDSDGFEFTTELIGQRASFGQQFETHVGYGALIRFYIYDNIVHNSVIRLCD